MIMTASSPARSTVNHDARFSRLVRSEDMANWTVESGKVVYDVRERVLLNVGAVTA
jgi:hypothetical protein